MAVTCDVMKETARMLYECALKRIPENSKLALADAAEAESSDTARQTPGFMHCPPVVIGVGVGGSFDHAAKLAKLQTLRRFGTTNPEPILADMEGRLTRAVNATGFGPMGTGGDTAALGVHIDYASGHGFTPVAVCFNCWIVPPDAGAGPQLGRGRDA